MNRREIYIWGAFAALFICILFITFHQRAPESSGGKAGEDFYRRAMGKFNPVEYHSQRAYAFDAEHSFESAVQEYKKLLELRPDDKNLHSHLGAIYYKMGMKDQAIAEIEEVLRRDPYDWTQRESVGDIYLEKGDVDEALRQYEQSLEINPANALCNRKVGKLYYQKGDYNSAVRAFARSVEIDPGFAESHLGLGLSCCALGDKEGALAEVKKLEELKRTAMAAQLSEAISRMKASGSNL